MENENQKVTEPTPDALITYLEELRVKAHLLGMEAHDEFEKLRREIKTLGGKVNRTTKQAAKDLMARLREIESSFVIPD